MNAPASFHHTMNDLLANGRLHYVVIYLDDLVIFSHTLEEHKHHVGEVLLILNNAHFQVLPSKCAIATRQIQFQDPIVAATTVEPTPDKFRASLDVPLPSTLSQAYRFLGKIRCNGF